MRAPDPPTFTKSGRLRSSYYQRELAYLQAELVKLQYWIRAHEERVVLVFEGRDAAGKGGTIKRIAEVLNPRYASIVALGTPTERERSQWYFQRYVAHLPAAGEIAMFDRSWYNRAGVERVMGFCTDAQYEDFLVACPAFEKLLVRSGIRLIKFWFSVSAAEQERRFQERIHNTTKRWKISPMDLESRKRWVDYSRAKDAMLEHTHTSHAPWTIVPSDDKRRARLTCIRHVLRSFDYEDLVPGPIALPPRQVATGYERPPMDAQHFVADPYGDPA
jgi:polyphosphate kinase 2